MTTYFCRLTQACDIDAPTLDRLWEERRLAIHFPYLEHEEDDPHRRAPDTRCLDPDKYPSSGKRAIRALQSLAREGGYVCVEQIQRDGGRRTIVGKVPPKSKIELCEGRWRSVPTRTAVLKTLRLKQVRIVRAAIPELVYGRPQQGTIMRWRRVGDFVERLVEGKKPRKQFSALSPTGTEVLCSEYLRRRSGRLRLQTLIAPVGRTMRAVDIWGLNSAGEQIMAQVTQSCDASTIRAKCTSLSKFGHRGCHLVVFAPKAAAINAEGVKHIHLEEVFGRFLHSAAGERWWKVVPR